MAFPSRRMVLSAALGATALVALDEGSVGYAAPAPAAPVGRTRRARPHPTSARLEAPALIQGSFASSAMKGATVGWAVSYPAGTRLTSTLPVVLALHGGFGDHLQVFDGMGCTAAQASPTLATDIVIASADAGTSYYHQRADGTDAGAMLVQEFLPLLATRGLDTSRLALTGFSMGGYGALLLAATLLQGKVAAVAPISASLWPTDTSAPSYAFDGAADYAAHDVYAMRSTLASVPLRVACGLDDPFITDNQQFVDGFDSPPEATYTPGGHDNGYWVGAAMSQVTFLAEHLAATPSSTDL